MRTNYSFTLKDLQGLCSNQLFKDSASSTSGSTLLLGLGQLPVQPDDGERELLVGGLWKQPWMLYISSVRVPLARNQMATGRTVREAGKRGAAAQSGSFLSKAGCPGQSLHFTIALQAV